MTLATRHDVLSQSSAVTSRTRYDIAGSPVAQLDPLNRKVAISYTDNFNSSGNPTTYAYPTTITDPAGNSSTVKYRYDIGANVEATSPTPAGQSYGKTTKRVFDSVGRLDRNSVYVSTAEKAYTRYVYPTNGIQSQTYSTLVDVNVNSIPDTGDEVYSEQWFDGAGRLRQSRTEHPGSTGGWTGVLTEYDILGRTTRTSVPTEINSSYATSGDDATRGFIWNYQYYDWQNRVTRTVPSDSTGSDNKDTLITYEGCGCAGGQVTTVKGPVTTAVGMDGQTYTTKRRTNKIFEDILGRTSKTEIRDLDGTALYSTVETAFNGRDQPVYVTQTESQTSTTQVTTASYDGHGRLKTKHIPQQTTGTYTTYNYNADDSISSVVDARGVSTGYTYNTRGLPTNIAWTVPGGSGITDPTDVTFSYDNVGNRTQMTDGLGTQSYAYDSLSRLTGETRQFNDDLPNAPQANDSFTIGYTYHIGGALKSLTEPYGVTVNYTLDKVGRLTGVSPSSSFGGLSSFASNAQYRAWGALKHLDYANGVAVDQTFNNRLQPATHETATSTVDVMQKTYQYYGDGMLKHVDDGLNWKFDRLNVYDFAGRLKQGKSSSEADGTTVLPDNYDQTQNLPYRQTYSHNAFGNMTERYFKLWGGNANLNGYTVNYSFTNNRIGNSGWVYDNDGRVTTSAAPENLSNLEYDAAGQLIEKNDTLINYAEDELIRHYDGDGRELKRTDRECRLQDGGSLYECVWNDPQTLYYVRSSVFGGEVIAEAGVSGDGGKRMVRVGSGVLAYLTHRNQSGTFYDAVHFEHADALGVSQRVTRATPEDLFGVTTEDPDYIDQRQAEFDPTGSSVGTTTNYIQQYEAVNQDFPGLEQESTLYVNGQQISVEVDGVAISFQTFQNMVGSGSVVAGEFRNGRYYTQHAIGSLSLSGGSSSVFIPGDNNAPTPAGGNPNSAYGTRDRWEMISFGYAWGSQQRPPRGPSTPLEPEVNPLPSNILDRCNHWLKSYYPLLKSYFDKLWEKTQQSKSEKAPDGLEAGGVIHISDSKVSVGGIEETGLDIYDGPGTTKNSMGDEFDKWQLERKRVRWLADPGLTLLVVHTHPDGDGRPSGPGDYKMATNHPEAVVGMNEISVYQKGKGILCMIKR